MANPQYLDPFPADPARKPTQRRESADYGLIAGQEGGDIHAIHDEASAAAGRAPLAIAASLGVMTAGALFVFYAMNLSPQRQAPVGPASDETASAARVENPVETIAPVNTQTAARISQTVNEDAAPLTQDSARQTESGIVPRLKPFAAVETGITPPSLKPAEIATDAPRIASAKASRGSSVLSLAGSFIADESDRPPSFFFAADIAPERAPPPSLTAMFEGDLPNALRDIRVSLDKGETFVDALRRVGVDARDRNEAAYAFGKFQNLRALRPGQVFQLTLADPNETLFQRLVSNSEPPAKLIALEFRPDAEKRIEVTRAAEGFTAQEFNAPLTRRVAEIDGSIEGSLYLSAKRQGAPDEAIAGLARMFAYDVDFQREIFGGDEFEALFEVYYDDKGRIARGGDILYGRLKWRGRQREKGYYLFKPAGAPIADYFDASGESARRLLMKTPIDGARISSTFGRRKHPVLGYMKAHKGVDFAAARGTPIMAAGDGVIERAGPYGSFGNYIRIRHAQGYKTAYAHLNSIKRGVRSGKRVRQGEIIGYVGTTGRSTGPHLHYEVHYHDKQVNPMSLKIATGYKLNSKDRARFEIERDRIDAMRAAAERQARIAGVEAGAL
ncbi:MAG: peptidoglycan DD-metalloendopeptidase family protein [Parvularculaceae bacterium]